MYQAKTMWGYSKKMVISNPRRESPPDTDPAITFTLDFQPLELWEINSYRLSHPAYGILLHSPGWPWYCPLIHSSLLKSHYAIWCTWQLAYRGKLRDISRTMINIPGWDWDPSLGFPMSWHNWMVSNSSTFTSHLLILLTVWPGESSSTFLSLCFLICKMRVIACASQTCKHYTRWRVKCLAQVGVPPCLSLFLFLCKIILFLKRQEKRSKV